MLVKEIVSSILDLCKISSDDSFISQKYAIEKKLSKKEFQDFIQDNFLKGFNLDSMSSVSNAELSNLSLRNWFCFYVRSTEHFY